MELRMFGKMMSNRSEQRTIVIRLLRTLIKLGFSEDNMRDAFPNYNGIDIFISRYSKTEVVNIT